MDSKSKYFQYCAQKGKVPIRVKFEVPSVMPPKFVASIASEGYNFTSEERDSKKQAEMEVYDKVWKTIDGYVQPSKFNINNLVDSLVGEEAYCEMYYKDVEGIHCTIIFKEAIYNSVAPSRSYARSKALNKIPEETLKFSTLKKN